MRLYSHYILEPFLYIPIPIFLDLSPVQHGLATVYLRDIHYNYHLMTSHGIPQKMLGTVGKLEVLEQIIQVCPELYGLVDIPTISSVWFYNVSINPKCINQHHTNAGYEFSMKKS